MQIMAYHSWNLNSKELITKKNLVTVLASNRGLKTESETSNFLNPQLSSFFNLKLSDIPKSIKRINEAIENKEKIVVYSDYDADGICATAILWETLSQLGAKVMPYVPDRISEGYGLNNKAIEKLAKSGVTLIITVDHGVTAKTQVELAKKLGVDVIITDHHTIPKDKPKPFAFVHTVELAGCGVAFKLAYELGKIWKIEKDVLEKIELVAIGTVADLVPLNHLSRPLVKFGLEKLNHTKRPGLLVLIKNANFKLGEIDTWHIGHIIAPRINAAGRLENAVKALRLLCTKDMQNAQKITSELIQTNSRRQELTAESLEHARNFYISDNLIGVVASEKWHEGIIGLVAARLVDEYYRPMIVISKGEKVSKGSARSIFGFNIIEAIRECSDVLIDAGGHPMAAGFSIETTNIEIFTERITAFVNKKIDEKLLNKSLSIEGEVKLSEIDWQFYESALEFAPFGIASPEPIFMSKGLVINDVYSVGIGNKHLKLIIAGFEAIGFGLGEERVNLRPGDKINLAFVLIKNNWNGNSRLEFKIKDLRIVNK